MSHVHSNSSNTVVDAPLLQAYDKWQEITNAIGFCTILTRLWTKTITRNRETNSLELELELELQKLLT